MNTENIDALINEALSIEQDDARQANAIGYMARAMIQATMPHSKIDGHEFKRSNGLFKLTMLADSEIGLPYGSIPRLLMSWITTEAVRTQQKEIILGNTLSEFMAELDMIPSGGRWGSITRLKSQMKKLFATSISVTCSDEDNKNWGIRNITPIEKADLWWDTKNPNQATLWESKLLLGEPFFNEIIENPVPVDMRALKALRQSPMAIDIYCWLTYRMSYLRRITNIPWHALQIQFGSNYKDVRQFKRKFLGHLKKVLLVYPDARVKDNGLSLMLSPSKTHIKQQRKLEGISDTANNITQEKKSLPENALIRKDYAEYRINSVISLIDEMPDENERHSLLKEFETHLTRTGLTKMREQIIKNKHTYGLKKELYHFVDNNWNHVLSSLKSYAEFQESQSL